MDPANGPQPALRHDRARPDWVLSRQRAWGVPLTCFSARWVPADGSDDFLLRDTDVNARIWRRSRSKVRDAWYKDGAKERFLERYRD